MTIPDFKLNDGNSIPALGLGTWQSTPDEVYNAVLEALKLDIVILILLQLMKMKKVLVKQLKIVVYQEKRFL